MNKKEIELDEMYPIIKEVLDSDGEFTLYPRGISMMPLIRQGLDSVTIVSAEDIEKNDIAFYIRDNGQFVLHRVVNMENDTFTMCGDNQFVFEKGIKKDQIFAKIKYITRDGITFGKDNKKYIKYVKKLPYRRLKLKISYYLHRLKEK